MRAVTSTIVLALFLAAAPRARGQESPLTVNLADDAYANHEYLKAAHLYEKVAGYHKVPADLPLKLATCYRELNDYSNSARWYKVVTDKTPAGAEDWIHYGDALKSLGMYADAKTAYRHTPDSIYNKIQNRVAGCDSAQAWIATPTAYQVVNEEAINTPNSDWGAVGYAHHAVVFTSDSSRTGSTRIDKRTGRPFQKVYLIDAGPLGSDSISEFAPVVNDNEYHDGAIAFSPTGDTAYYSLTNPGSAQDPLDHFKGKEGKRRVKIDYKRLEIWWTVLDSGKWGPAHPFPYNNQHYSVGQATLSHDGRILYFASDMPGGYGKTDIWYVERQGDSAWSVPVNCGPLVNSEEDEAFPWVGLDGNLYFASKGHVGMGGYDVFRAVGGRADWKDLNNLRYPVNSSGDDFYFTQKDSLSGFLSSDRPGGKGSDDIYSFSRKPQEPPVAFVPTRPDLTFDLLTTSEHFKPVIPPVLPKPTVRPSGKVTTEGSGTEIAAIPKPPPPPRVLVLKTLVVDYLSGQPMPGARVAMGDDPVAVTGSDGTIFRVLDPKDHFTDSAFKENYGAAGHMVVAAPLWKSKATDTLTVTLRLVKRPVEGDLFEMRNIYFDFDKSKIRPDAAVELDRLVAYLRQFPKVIIDLSAHTDSRGDDDYNQLLSERRALSARHYLLDNQIALHRIITHGYGESMPVNGCKNGVTCTEPEYQLNRRIEVKVLHID
jgi:outer membrane protein OmpA-like peptidoglycan-associated protein